MVRESQTKPTHVAMQLCWGRLHCFLDAEDLFGVRGHLPVIREGPWDSAPLALLIPSPGLILPPAPSPAYSALLLPRSTPFPTSALDLPIPLGLPDGMQEPCIATKCFMALLWQCALEESTFHWCRPLIWLGCSHVYVPLCAFPL